MSGKTALIVFAREERTSFNFAMMEAAQTALEKKGWTVLVSDLYEMDFNPVMSRDDITGEPKEPSNFKYVAETLTAWQEGRLAKDIVEEHKKVEKADLVIFQFPLQWYGMPAIMKGWVERVFSPGFAYSLQEQGLEGMFKHKKAVLSFTTGGLESMFSPKGRSGDINVILWPIQHGILSLCGFQVLGPQISYSVARLSQEVRVGMLKSWGKRLETIWGEEPLQYFPLQDFEDWSGGGVLKKEVEAARSGDKYGPTVGQNLGKPLSPDSELKSAGAGL